MQGKVCLITGATRGIGEATARGLAREGATVVAVVRDRARGEALVSALKAGTGNPNIDLLVGDLALMAEVRRVAAEFRTRYDRLHVLVNNAGGIFERREVTVDGFERTFALNHLAYFLLANLLLDTLKASAPARVISVSSGAHMGGRMALDDLQLTRGYALFRAYGMSKLANLLFAYELARRLQGTRVTSNAMNPGGTRTGFALNNRGWLKWGWLLAWPFLRSAEQGADTVIYLATSPEIEGVTGQYFDSRRAVRSSAESYDEDAARRLWDESARLTDLI